MRISIAIPSRFVVCLLLLVACDDDSSGSDPAADGGDSTPSTGLDGSSPAGPMDGSTDSDGMLDATVPGAPADAATALDADSEQPPDLTDAGLPPGTAPFPGGGVFCDHRAVRCRVAEPDCGEGSVASVDPEVGCYGPCVDIRECGCAEAQDCPKQGIYTCWGTDDRCNYYGP